MTTHSPMPRVTAALLILLGTGVAVLGSLVSSVVSIWSWWDIIVRALIAVVATVVVVGGLVAWTQDGRTVKPPAGSATHSGRPLGMRLQLLYLIGAAVLYMGAGLLAEAVLEGDLRFAIQGLLLLLAPVVLCYKAVTARA